MKLETHYKLNKMKTEVRTITPAVAKEMLKRNYNNRPPSKSHVEKLSQSMLKDQWLFDGQPIRFDEHDRLIDGQHRLNAIVKSNTTHKFLVVSGLKSDSFMVMDTGKSRSAGDSLHILGIQYARTTAAAIRFIISFKKGNYWASSGSNPITNTDVVEFYNKNTDLTEDVPIIERLYKEFNHVLPKGMLLGLHFLMKEKNVTDAKKFIHQLCTGLGLEKTNPIYHLRKALVKDKMSDYNMNTSLKLALIAKCWNTYRKNQEMKLLVPPKKIEVIEFI